PTPPATSTLSLHDALPISNDVSGRDLQFSDGQWVRGKSLDTFLPVGDLVPAHQIPDPQALPIRAVLNGETMQDSSMSNMIFGVRSEEHTSELQSLRHLVCR